jgi:hypothetical protein
MPPAVTQPINIHVGRGDLWIGVDVPLVPPVPLVGGIPATGRFIGATIAPANFIYRPTTFDIMTQQDTSVQGYVNTAEDLRLEFELGEITYENLRDAWLGALDQGQFISLGGIVFPKTFSCLIIAPKRLGNGSAFIQAMIYSSVFTEDRQFPFARESWSNPRIVARGQGVPTRQQGDRLGFLHPHVVTA